MIFPEMAPEPYIETLILKISKTYIEFIKPPNSILNQHYCHASSKTNWHNYKRMSCVRSPEFWWPSFPTTPCCLICAHGQSQHSIKSNTLKSIMHPLVVALGHWSKPLCYLATCQLLLMHILFCGLYIQCNAWLDKGFDPGKYTIGSISSISWCLAYALYYTRHADI